MPYSEFTKQMLKLAPEAMSKLMQSKYGSESKPRREPANHGLGKRQRDDDDQDSRKSRSDH